MAIDPHQMLVEFPEFKRADIALVQAKLAEADLVTAADYAASQPGARAVRVKYLAAELMALSPGAEFARLDPKKEPDGARSIYERRRRQLDESFVVGLMVV